MRLLAISPFFRDSNYIECALWCAIGVVFLIRGAIWPFRRHDALTAGVTFLLFGLSDYIEASTGAWWRPWWLLVWKAACLGVFLILLIGNARRKAKAES